jgi:hypothetical protein
MVKDTKLAKFTGKDRTETWGYVDKYNSSYIV